MKRNVILIVIGIIIVNSCDGANLHKILRPKRAESDFILRSCIASAQLTRKHRTNDASQLSSAELPSASLALNELRAREKHPRGALRLRSRPKARQLADKSTTDTPLGTLDVKAARKDMPKLFRKKEPLPELDRAGSARNLDIDAPIYVVRPLKL